MLHVKFSLYLKRAGLASRNIVHLPKNILRCIGFLSETELRKADRTVGVNGFLFCFPFSKHGLTSAGNVYNYN